jgi:hypothetical protein
LLFSVIIALAQLWLIPSFYYLTQKPWTWAELVGNGCLLFYATTITSKTAGEYFKRVKTRNEWATLVCIAMTFIIVALSVFVYALVTATRAGLVLANPLSPERVARISDGLALSGLIFSGAFTLIIRAYGR